MKDAFFKFVGKLIMPMCFIMICMSLFRDYLYMLPYIFVVRIILLICAITMVIGAIMKPYTPKSFSHREKNLKEYFYFNSYNIIENIFSWYICIYILLRLDRVSIVFSYIMILIFGIYYGHRIANIADIYYKNKYKQD